MPFAYGRDWRNRSPTILSYGLLCLIWPFRPLMATKSIRISKQIGAIEGAAGLLGRFCQVRHLDLAG